MVCPDKGNGGLFVYLLYGKRGLLMFTDCSSPPFCAQQGRKASKNVYRLRAAHFLRLRRHNAVQLGIFRETVYKGQNDVAIE